MAGQQVEAGRAVDGAGAHGPNLHLGCRLMPVAPCLLGLRTYVRLFCQQHLALAVEQLGAPMGDREPPQQLMAISHDEHADRFVWGLISDLDVLRAGMHLGPGASARALALDPIVSVRPTMPLREAGELMLKHDVSHLIVVDPDTQRPTGVLSTLDIAGVLAWGEA